MRSYRPLLAKIPGDARHWTTVFLLIGVGVWAGHWLGERDVWIRLRYHLYQRQQKIFSPSASKASAKWTALVLVGDDEYWKGEELARRVPINRDYLAQLLDAVAAANPQVIALDFNLSSPAPDGSLREHQSYSGETERLVKELRKIADIPRGPIVVLARTIEYDDRTDRFIAQPAVYDGHDLPRDRVRSGYIELPYDLRQVPLPVELMDGSDLDSFSTAAVRAAGGEGMLELAKSGKGELPYGSFLDRSALYPDSPIPALRVLQGDPKALNRLEHKIVLIGAGWSQFAYGVGGPVDTSESPIGTVQKVYMHANYIEALLNAESRIFKPLPEGAAIAIEVFLSVVIAWVFSLRLSRGRTFFGAISACFVVILVTYFIYKNLGLFFDFFIPLVLLTCHSIYEQVAEWREAAHKYEALEHVHPGKRAGVVPATSRAERSRTKPSPPRRGRKRL